MRTSGKKPIATREATLRGQLNARRQALIDDVQRRIASRRRGPGHDIRDELEQTDADTQNDMALARLHAQTTTLRSVEAALARLDAGTYGSCSSCQGDIPPVRLAALPFAVRCHACERDRERTQGPRGRALSGSPAPLFGDRAGP